MSNFIASETGWYYGDVENDTLVLLDSGNKIEFSGGDGVDTVSLTADAQVDFYPNNVFQVQMGNSHLDAWGAEILKIADGSAYFNLNPSYDGSTVGLTVAAMYQAAFDRNPDAAGMEFWMTSGVSEKEMAGYFLASPEGQTKLGGLSDGAFLDDLYGNILGRSADAEGKAFWENAMAHGVDRGEVLADFASSQENVALVGSAHADLNGWAHFG